MLFSANWTNRLQRRLLVSTETAVGKGVLVSVADQGCVIPPEEIEHIFKPFFTTKTQGMGLGLALILTLSFVQFSKAAREPFVSLGSTSFYDGFAGTGFANINRFLLRKGKR